MAIREILEDISIGKRLLGGFILVSFLMLSVGLIGSVQMEQIYGTMDQMYTENTVPLMEIGNIEVGLNSIRSILFRTFAIPEEIEFDRERMKGEIDAIEGILSEFRSRELSDDLQTKLTLFESQWETYKQAVDEVMALQAAGKIAEARAGILSGGIHANARRATAETFEALKEVNLKEAAEKAEASRAAKDYAQMIMGVSALIFLAIAIAFSAFLTRTITLPLQQVMDQFGRLSNGVVSSRMQFSRKDEIGTLAETSDRFSDFLEHEVVDSMKRIAHGDVAITLSPKCDDDQITPALMETISALDKVLSQLETLSTRAAEGELSVRGDTTGLLGSYQDIVHGFNTTLDAVVMPVQEAIVLSQRYADCDFTAEFSDTVSIQGEFVIFRDALDSIGREVSHSLATVNAQMNELVEQAKKATVGIDDVKNGAELIASVADKTKNNAERSEEGIVQVLRAMEDLTTTVSSVSSNVEAVSQASNEADALAQNGIERVNQAESGMNSIRKTSADTAVIISDIQQEMAEIGNINNIITSISDQINLLALNAAIEAARAGDAGRGFAVVADEVKSLANQTGDSANKITRMIEELSRKIQRAEDAMSQANLAVSTGAEAVEKAMEIFNKLNAAVYSISKNMESVAGATEEQAASFQEITASVQEMSDLVKETAKDALNSSATAEQALSVVSQINQIIYEIEVVVATTNKEMHRFIIRK